MKKLSLLIIALCLTLGTAQARTVKKSFDFSQAKKEWNADKLTLTNDNKTICFNGGQQAKKDSNGNEVKDDQGNTVMEDVWGNAAVSWLGGTVTDISKYDRLVLELEEASDGTVEVAVSMGDFWTNYYSTTLEKGGTKLTINLEGLKVTTSDTEKGSDIDLTKVNMIYLRTGWTHEQTIKIKDFYLEQEVNDYDQVLTKGSTTPLDLSKMDALFTYAGTPKFDASTGTLTIAGTGDNGTDINLGYGFNGLSYNVADYDRIVVKAKVEAQDWHGLFVRVEQDNVKGNYQADGISASDGEKTITIELGDAFKANNDLGDGVTEGGQITTINRLFFWTMSVTKAVISEVALEKDGAVTYLVRENTTPKYGTICLPFAAKKPTNASVYKVRGVDSNDEPSNLYLESVESLEAGVAYVYQSKDEQDVTFDKQGDADNLESPATATSGLVGTFAQTNVPEGNYILVGGTWKKAVSGAQVGKYRASLNVAGLAVITDQQAEGKYFAMGLEGGEATGIANVKANANAEATHYTLGGVRTSKPTKGLYIVNGKKVLK